MKKLLAILLSVLMLCSVIPFAAISVSAADEYYIELVADAEEVNAGDEVTVEVSLYGHEDLGLIGAIVELGFDPDVFELVTYYDEDEEVWMPPIEVGSKFNASSNKYITFPPIDEETGYMERCLVTFLRATASASQAVKTNLYYTVTFKVKDDAPSGTYEIDFINYNKKNIIQYGNTIVDWTWEPITITVNGSEPEVPSCEHEYEYDCDKVCSKCGEETRPEAEHTYNYACDQYCNECGEKTNAGAKHNILHVEAKEAVSCIEFGNKEYWHCDACGAAWLDAAGRYQTNMMSVLTAGPCISNAEFACQDGECINCGLPYAPDVDHTYANAHDASCDVCGTIRDVVLSESEIILFDGTSIKENSYGTGLAFKFDAAINGIVINEGYIGDYSNATATINGVEYKLINMGAIVNNKSYSNQTLDNVDGSYVKDVPAAKVFEDGGISFAVRVLNIPEIYFDTVITARPYYVYENAEGEQITVYGEDYTSTYNSAR